MSVNWMTARIAPITRLLPRPKALPRRQCDRDQDTKKGL